VNLSAINRQITLQFKGRNSDRRDFSEGLNSLEGVESLVYPYPTPLPETKYSDFHFAAYAPDQIVNTIVMIIATAGGIAEIASFIRSVLKDKSAEKGNRKIESILVKSDSKRVEISGNLSKDEIIKILRASATVTDSDQASKWLKEQQNQLDSQDIKQRLKVLDDALSKYRRLLALYERDDALKSWQKADYARYKARTESLGAKLRGLKRRLRKLQEESRALQHQ
jgi:cell division protein YceG involved in septum cleavage